MLVITRNGKTTVLAGWRAWLAGAAASDYCSFSAATKNGTTARTAQPHHNASIEDIDYRYAVYLFLCLQLRFIRSNERPNVVR